MADSGYRQTKPWDCPWVICTRTPSGKDYVFFSIEENRTYDLKLNVDERATCCGSSEGWVAMGHRLTRKFLVNPITQDKIQKVVVSSSTLDSTKIIVLHANNKKSSICCLGDKSCTQVCEEKHRYNNYEDFVLLKDGSSRYLIGNELSQMQEGRRFMLITNGKLLVIKLIFYKIEGLSQLRFHIYGEVEEASGKWNSVSHLGDRTLFISSACSESVVAKDQSVFQRNSIYFIDPELRELPLISLDDLRRIKLDLGELIPQMLFFPSA